MSVPVENIPISLKNVVTTFEGFSGTSNLILSTITVFPGTQPEVGNSFIRNWNFVISGAITSPEPVSTFTIHMDLSKVAPSYIINFSGPVNGTLQIAKKSKNRNIKLYSTFQYVAFVANNTTKTIELVVTVPCPSKNFYFNIDSYVADSGSNKTYICLEESTQLGTLYAGCTFLGYGFDVSGFEVNNNYTISLLSLSCIAKNWLDECGTTSCGTQNDENQSFYFEIQILGTEGQTVYVNNFTGSGLNDGQIYLIYNNYYVSNSNSASSDGNFNATISGGTWTNLNNCVCGLCPS